MFMFYVSGLPKAAIITHKRSVRICITLRLCDLSAKDIVYAPLPLYHSSATIIGVNGVIELGMLLYQ